MCVLLITNRNVQEEGEKVLSQMIRLIAQRNNQLLAQHERVVQCLAVLLEVIDDSELVSATMSRNCMVGVHQLFRGFGVSKEVFVLNMSAALAKVQLVTKLEQVLSIDMKTHVYEHTPSSPLATAPIHDVLMRR